MPDTQQVALYVDARTGLVSKYELVFTDPLRGQSASEIMFSDYATAGKLKVPQTWTWRFAGDVVARYKVNAQFNAADTDKALRWQTRDSAKCRRASADVEAERGEARRWRLCDSQRRRPESEHDGGRVQRLHRCGRSAGTSDGADNVIKRIKETIPGKPIRYVAITHHHGDHIGGLRSFIAEGATVITTRGNREVVETMATAPQNDRLSKIRANPSSCSSRAASASSPMANRRSS